MSLSPIEKIVIRHGLFSAKQLNEPKMLELTGSDFARTGIPLQSGLQLANYILSMKAPNLNSGVDIGKLTYEDNSVIYIPKHPEIGNILRRSQFDLDIIPEIADDEYPPKIENMNEHILPINTPFRVKRGDIILARAYNEQIQNISGTYVEIYQIFRDGSNCKS